MFTVTTTWNLTRPDQEALADFDSLERRGYNSELVSLTGQLATKIADKTILPLSVSDIADKRCIARRDLYLRKGVGRISSAQRRKMEKPTWGHKAGSFVEKYVMGTVTQEIDNFTEQKYAATRAGSDSYHQNFVDGSLSDIAKLKTLESTTQNMVNGDTEWLLRLLKCNGRLESGAHVLHLFAKEINDFDLTHIELNRNLHPKTREIGINSPATPDFIVPNLDLVGDVKTSIRFEAHFQLTCAGYALAYENEYGDGNNINWGIIYLLPTRNPTAYVRPLTFAQLYVFAIDDVLRTWFLYERDKAYRVLAEEQIPNVRDEDLENNCPYCRYKQYCEEEG